MHRHWLSVLTVTMVTFMVSAVFTFLQPMEYRSAFTVLLVEQNSSLDGYSASKSAERWTSSLAQLLNTGAFSDTLYKQMKDQEAFKGNSLFSDDTQIRQESWKRHLATSTQPEAGLLTISVFQEDPKMAQDIATALSVNLISDKSREFIGGKDMSIKIVDYPLVSKRPVRPNIPVNLAAGILLGLAGSLAFFALRGLTSSSQSEPQYQLHMPVYAPPAVMSAPRPVEMKPMPPTVESSPEPAMTPSLDHMFEHQMSEPVIRQTDEAMATMAVPGFRPRPPKNLPIGDEWVMP